MEPWPTLDAKAYSDPDLFKAEREVIFLSNWQMVAHQSDLPKTGDYLVFDLLDQSAILIRGDDGKIRAFHNACRHRAFRLLDGEGASPSRIRCKYHGFSYALDGHLAGVPGESDFPGFDKSCMGLKAVELEIWHGFLFIRFGGKGPTIAEQMQPLEKDLTPFRFAEMQPFGPESRNVLNANWKVAVENNVEAYHVPVGHPGLQRLFGERYGFQVLPLGVSRAGAALAEPDQPGLSWSERHYLKLLPPVDNLPNHWQRRWGYVSLFPNVAFDLYPDQIDFFQLLPIAPDFTLVRSRGYALPDDRREMRAARWLNQRINRLVTAEDLGLVEGVQRGLQSLGYGQGFLSRREARVKQFQDKVREALKGKIQ